MRVARNEAAAPHPERDAVCFHCQQAAEKYLKALLCELGLFIPRIHELDQDIMAIMAAKPQNKTGRALYYRYVPPDIPLSAIRRFAHRIAEKFDPEKIILFGSFAYGTPHEESDVDLLVVMPAWNEISKSIRITLAFDREFPLDLIVRTPERLRRRLAEGDSFLQEITSKGIVVYEKRNPTVGEKGRKRSARRPQGGGQR